MSRYDSFGFMAVGSWEKCFLKQSQALRCVQRRDGNEVNKLYKGLQVDLTFEMELNREG